MFIVNLNLFAFCNFKKEGNNALTNLIQQYINIKIHELIKKIFPLRNSDEQCIKFLTIKFTKNASDKNLRN